MWGQSGFFDVDERLKRLSDLGDQLEAFGAAVDFEIFRAELMGALAYSDGAQGGRPPFDPVMMFKILVIQAANNLSDERAEFLINDRLSFMRFLGLAPVRSCSGRPHDLAVSGEADEGGRHQGAVRPVRHGAARCRLHRHERANRRRQPDRRAEAAQHGRREEGDQARPHSRRLEGQAVETPPQGSRRALDGEVLQGQGAIRRDEAAGRHRHPDLRLSEPCRDRSRFRPDPPMGGD